MPYLLTSDQKLQKHSSRVLSSSVIIRLVKDGLSATVKSIFLYSKHSNLKKRRFVTSFSAIFFELNKIVQLFSSIIRFNYCPNHITFPVSLQLPSKVPSPIAQGSGEIAESDARTAVDVARCRQAQRLSGRRRWRQAIPVRSGRSGSGRRAASVRSALRREERGRRIVLLSCYCKSCEFGVFGDYSFKGPNYVEQLQFILNTVANKLANVAIEFHTTQTQHKVKHEHLQFDLFWLVGDVEAGHAGIVQRGLLIGDLLVQVQHQFHVLLFQLLRMLQFHHVQNVIELFAVLDFSFPNVNFVCGLNDNFEEHRCNTQIIPMQRD